MYHCEVGVQAGIGYYVGDATRHIFNDPLETFGAQFRYKFDRRWALQVKAQRHRITFRESGKPYYNPMWNTDITGEFNFFRFGEKQYDRRIKPITPYIFWGIGVSVYGEAASPSAGTPFPSLLNTGANVGVYMPLGIGVKWQFAHRWQLHAAWQHMLFFADNIEGIESLNNTYGMNGSNLLNNDLTSTLTLGIVFEFAQEKKVCRLCR